MPSPPSGRDEEGDMMRTEEGALLSEQSVSPEVATHDRARAPADAFA